METTTTTTKPKTRLPLVLEEIRIATPCSADWDDMQGDERVRFCGKCEKNVYNLSMMTREAGEALGREKEGGAAVCAPLAAPGRHRDHRRLPRRGAARALPRSRVGQDHGRCGGRRSGARHLRWARSRRPHRRRQEAPDRPEADADGAGDGRR